MKHLRYDYKTKAFYLEVFIYPFALGLLSCVHRYEFTTRRHEIPNVPNLLNWNTSAIFDRSYFPYEFSLYFNASSNNNFANILIDKPTSATKILRENKLYERIMGFDSLFWL